MPRNSPGINRCGPSYLTLCRASSGAREHVASLVPGGTIGPRERVSFVPFVTREYLTSAHILSRNQGVFGEIRLLLQGV